MAWIITRVADNIRDYTEKLIIEEKKLKFDNYLLQDTIVTLNKQK
jgi:hypothetical protein